jgi:hypothetical protein
MPASTILLYQTHFFDRASERSFRRLQEQCPPHFQCAVLLHAPPGSAKPPRLARVPHHFVTTDQLRALPYPRKLAEDDWTGRRWELWGGGHCDLIPLHFMRSHPGHDRYWVMEYDVAFTGSWRRFFDAFEDSPADLLTACIRRRAADPWWVNWPSLQGVFAPEELESHATAALLPLFRTSGRLARAIDAAYAAGFGGHVEGSWSTLASLRGMVLEDFGGEGEFVAPGNHRRFYTASPSTAVQFYLAPGTFFAKPAMYRPGLRPNTLWHPVKPFHWREELRQAIREYRIIGGAKRRQLQAWWEQRVGGPAAEPDADAPPPTA